MAADNILIIRHGALGDLVQSTGPFRAIREHHPGTRITLLTTPPFAIFMRGCPWIDDVWQDHRPQWFQVPDLLHLRRRLREGGFQRVYDLQTSSRSSHYRRAFSRGNRPDWSGVAPGASHPHANADRDLMHTLDRQAEQLAMAGIAEVPEPDLSWVTSDVSRFELLQSYALVVPGGSAHRPAKRWPADYYLEICRRLLAAEIQPVLIGGRDEVILNRVLAEQCPGVRDLADQTSIEDLAVLARGAKLAVGNDTGPMHVAAVSGCPSIVLFSDQSDPDLCAPRGANVTTLQAPDLAALSVARVWQAMKTS
ncbi:MAG: glycosyltransferase family 9 protein [Rhodospirillaceae bacterium]|nr:glycosyltransferase family 9 protein [Rhodospirillaceae bacterium]